MVNIKNESDIWFSCGCREWRIAKGDFKGITQKPIDTVIDHECKNIIVYRDYMGLVRHFKSKINKEE